MPPDFDAKIVGRFVTGIATVDQLNDKKIRLRNESVTKRPGTVSTWNNYSPRFALRENIRESERKMHK